jgi:hypothetical protein
MDDENSRGIVCKKAYKQERANEILKNSIG